MSEENFSLTNTFKSFESNLIKYEEKMKNLNVTDVPEKLKLIEYHYNQVLHHLSNVRYHLEQIETHISKCDAEQIYDAKEKLDESRLTTENAILSNLDKSNLGGNKVVQYHQKDQNSEKSPSGFKSWPKRFSQECDNHFSNSYLDAHLKEFYSIENMLTTSSTIRSDFRRRRSFRSMDNLSSPKDLKVFDISIDEIKHEDRPRPKVVDVIMKRTSLESNTSV